MYSLVLILQAFLMGTGKAVAALRVVVVLLAPCIFAAGRLLLRLLATSACGVLSPAQSLAVDRPAPQDC